jgi:hypothetical protein
MFDRPSCEVACPRVLDCTGRRQEIDQQLSELDARDAAHRQTAQEWDAALFGASAEERRAQLRIDDEPVGDMYTRRDRFEGLGNMLRAAATEQRRGLETEAGRLERRTEGLQKACDSGPGRRFGVLGAVVCRSGAANPYV